MDRLKKAAILITLVEKLRENGSWCGETHLQKSVYFLEDLLGVPLQMDFIIYKHGPFSFDLRDELTALRADELLKLEPQSPPYGPKIVLSKRSASVKESFPKTLKEYEKQLEFVGKKLGDKGVTELEQLATALYISKRKSPNNSVDERAKELVRIKPHILPDNARDAIEKVDQMIEETKNL
ncbi:MAG: hypothetical protein HQK88_04155 [Nitrospirae bacterium]|nr:hypothetical protein [Nitrospirota bacterium]MBF0533479.1 hypothetical protein [Nitrospirota bacterium]MBF0615997.1 hypothetical protein [Nitrospirota bacterium]